MATQPESMDASEFIQGRIAALSGYLLPAVRPLAVPDDLGDELWPAGTTVLVWYRGHRYAISAAHVLELYPDRAYYLGTQSSWVEIPHPWVMNKAPDGNRENDTLDFAFHRIDPGVADTLDGCRFLKADQQVEVERVRFEGPERTKYLAIGYPLNRFELKRFRRTTKPRNLAYAGSIADPAEYRAAKLDPHQNLAVKHDWKEVVSTKGVHSSPKLEGISGGPLFRFPAIEQPGSLELPRLAGITIEERRAQRLIVGTRLGLVFAAIARWSAENG